MRTSSRVTFASLRLHRGPHHRWLTISEAERMVQRGECKRLRLPRQRNPIYELVSIPEPSLSEFSQPSLTVHDITANVGLCDSKRRIYEAKIKIREFALTSPRHRAAA